MSCGFSRRRGLPVQTIRWLLLLALLASLAGPVVAAVSLVGERARAENGNAQTLDLDVPGGVQAGDLLLAQVVRRGSGAIASAPPGWSAVASDAYFGEVRQGIYYRIAGSSEPAQYRFQITSPPGVRAAGGMIAYRGVDPLAPIAGVEADVDESFFCVLVSVPPFVVCNPRPWVYAPPVGSAAAGAHVVHLFAIAEGSTRFVPLWTDARYRVVTSGSGQVTAAASDSALPAGGSAFAELAEIDGAGVPYVSHSVLLNPGDADVLDHIRIDHPGSAVTCEPASITLRACVDAGCTALYPDPVTVTLTSTPAGSWSSNPVTFTGTTTVSLAVTTPQTVTLGATSDPVATSATKCWAGAVQSCALAFTDTGFVFSPIPPQTAGTTSAAITLRAVTTSDNGVACTAALSGSHAIELASQCIDPVTCAGVDPTVGGTPIANNPASGIAARTPVTLAFDANASTQFTLNYADVGRLQLHARYETDAGAVLSGSSNTFVERPAGFSIASITGNPAATTANGPLFRGAGKPFSATVTARTSSGAPAPNFGNEVAPEAVQLVSSLELPAGGANPPLDNNTIAGGAFTAGAATVANLAWHEVGIIRLSGRVADGDYLGAGPVTGTPSTTIGRFVPDHFNVTVTDGCSASGITYSRQPFSVGVVAASAGDSTTSNYAGAFARPVTLSDAGDTAHFSSNMIPAAAFIGGVASAMPSHDDPASPPPVPRLLTLRAVDADGVSSSGYLEDQTELRHGRFRLDNVVSNALAPALMPVRIETWRADGGGALGWMVDSADTCTTLGSGDVQLTGVATLGTVTFANGVGTLQLLPTGAGNADVMLLIDAAAANALPWLQFDWDGDGSRDNPKARAGFGLHEGRDRQIFRREVID